MFASKTLARHLGRGAVGIGALITAYLLAPTHPMLSLVLVPLALAALRGCPMCWTIGLFQTVLAAVQGKSREGLCADGSCALTSSVRGPRFPRST